MKTRKLRKSKGKTLKRGGQGIKREREEEVPEQNMSSEEGHFSNTGVSLSSSSNTPTNVQQVSKSKKQKLTPEQIEKNRIEFNARYPVTTCEGILERAKLPSEGYKRIGVSDLDHPIQHLVNAIGDDDILIEFTKYLNNNERVPAILKKYDEDYQNKLKTLTGLYFNNGHWLGYENGVLTYNSYKKNGTNIQQEGTNNFCQSYAAYLWAKKGNLGQFVPGKYTDNIQRMSKIWLEFFKQKVNSNSNIKNKILQSIVNSSNLASEPSDEYIGPYTYEEIIAVLECLSKDENNELRTIFSNF